MSFFGKLKSKLFKSSSKLDEGLDAIVSDGGEETPTPEAPPPSDPTPPSPPAPQTPPPDVPAPPTPEEVPEPDLPEPELPEPPTPPEVPQPDLPAPETPQKIPQPDLPPDTSPAPGPDMPAPEPTPVSPPPPPVETPQPSDPIPSPPTEVQPSAPLEIPVQSVGLVEETPVAEARKPGFLGRLLGRTTAPTEIRRELDDEMLEQLEELLIQADMGVDTSLRVTANIAEGRYGKKLSVREIKELLAGEVARIMEPVAKPMPLYPTKPQVVLVVGVNGSGKTTTIGKLASQFRAAGKKVVIAAGDTFRADAVEQLQVWGDRAGVPVLTAPEGSDPPALPLMP